MTDLLSRLDDWSDRLSPIAVKEVRQMVRGREFNYSFGISLIVGLIIAFFGLTDSLNLSGTSGARVFSAMMVCLGLIGLAVVPLGGFAALRNERSDHTLDLVTQTALTPRRIVLGKLMTQVVKLVTLFAALSPFLAMSFLLGGIDLLTILLSLAMLFLWSVWACSACLFMSATSQSRVASGVLFAFMAIGFITFLGRFAFVLGPVFGSPYGGLGASSSALWWVLAASTTFCLISMTNLILLAENRLALAIEDRSTALRIGFLVQFLFIIVCSVGPSVGGLAGYTTANAAISLGIFGGIQLALVSIFAVSEDMVLSRRVLRTIQTSSKRPWMAIFRPGGGRGTAWVLTQMALLMGTGVALVSPSDVNFWWLLGICSYIAFYTGFPIFVARKVLQNRITVAQLRGLVILFLPLLMIASDILLYVMKPGTVFDGSYSAFHVLNPFRTLMNWDFVAKQAWEWRTFVMGFIGLLSYLALIRMGQRESRHAGISN